MPANPITCQITLTLPYHDAQLLLALAAALDPNTEPAEDMAVDLLPMALGLIHDTLTDLGTLTGADSHRHYADRNWSDGERAYIARFMDLCPSPAIEEDVDA